MGHGRRKKARKEAVFAPISESRPDFLCTKPFMGERKPFKPFIMHQSCHDSNMIRAFFTFCFTSYQQRSFAMILIGHKRISFQCVFLCRVVALHIERKKTLYVLRDIVRVLKGGEERQH